MVTDLYTLQNEMTLAIAEHKLKGKETKQWRMTRTGFLTIWQCQIKTARPLGTGILGAYLVVCSGIKTNI
jgi:hypothetical protein